MDAIHWLRVSTIRKFREEIISVLLSNKNENSALNVLEVSFTLFLFPDFVLTFLLKLSKSNVEELCSRGNGVHTSIGNFAHLYNNPSYNCVAENLVRTKLVAHFILALVSSAGPWCLWLRCLDLDQGRCGSQAFKLSHSRLLTLHPWLGPVVWVVKKSRHLLEGGMA